MRKPRSAYPAYSRSEKIADGAIHGLGVLGAVCGAIYLMVWQSDVGPGLTFALSVYAIALMATFCASAFYHMTPWEAIRPTLRQIDHAAIYLKIAGTYTPLVVMIGTGFGYAVLGLVWVLAVVGMVMKLFFWQSPGKLGTWLYLGMGWISVFLVWSLLPILPTAAMWLVTIGGLLYSAGTIFFSWESLKFSNAIWHGFVVAASACFFVAIALGAMAR